MNGQRWGSTLGGLVGAFAGSLIPPPYGAIASVVFGAIGAYTGGLTGRALDPQADPRHEQESIAGLMIQTSTLGATIPIIWKNDRVAGNVFSINGPFVEEDADTVGGSSGGGGNITNVTKTYFIDLAIGLCDTFLPGEMQEIRKIWADGNVVFDRTKDDGYPEGITFFSGAAVQAPSAMLEARKGVGNVPGFPYLCYITWYNLDIGLYPRVPNFTFELSQSDSGLSALHQMAWRPSDNSIWAAAPGVNRIFVYDSATQNQISTVKVDVLEVGNTVDVSKPFAMKTGFPMGWENGSDALWIAHPYDFFLKRIDATTKEVTHVFHVETTLRSGGFYHSGDMWFCSSNHNTSVGYLIRVNANDNGIATTIDCGQARQGVIKAVGVSATAVWVTAQHYPDGGGNSSAKRVNPATNTVTATVVTGSAATSRPIDIVTTPANNHVWVLDGIANTIIRINTTPVITATIAIGAVPLQCAVASDGFVWVATTYQGGTVYRINPTTNTAVAYDSLPLSQYSYAHTILTPGASGSMWVLSIKMSVIQRFSPDGTSIVARTGGTTHTQVAQGTTHVWTGTTRGMVQKITDAGTMEESPGMGDPHLRRIVARLCEAGGIPEEQLSLGGIPNPSVSLKLTSIQPVRAALELLMSAYQFFSIDSGSTLKFRSREPGAIVATIPESHLDAYDAGEQQEPPPTQGALITYIPDEPLPTELRFTYKSAGRHYQDKTIMKYVSNSRAGHPNPRAVSVALVMDDQFAHQVAQETLDQIWLQRLTYQFSIPQTYAFLEPGDRVRITSRGLEHILVISDITKRRPGILECTGRGDIAGQIGVEQGFTESTSLSSPQEFLAHTIEHFVNLPALNSNDRQERFHVGYEYPKRLWPGVTLLRSKDGVSYRTIHLWTGARATTGLVANALAAGTPYVIDETNSFSVVLNSSLHTLTSVSDNALIASGGTKVFLGSEVLSIGVATLTAPKTYLCSRLLRGQRGTEWAIGAHGANEQLLVLNGAVHKLGGEELEIYRDETKLYKSVTRDVQISTVTPMAFKATSENLRHWAVGTPQAYRHSLHWDLTWFTRSRFVGEAVDEEGFGYDSDHHGFHVKIYTNATFETIKRNIYTPSAADPEVIQTTTYSEAQQATDFSFDVSTLYWSVQATGGLLGAGRKINITSFA